MDAPPNPPTDPSPVVFAHIEKTAGKTTRELLRRHFGAGHCELYNNWRELRPEDLGFVRRHHPRLRSLAGHACMPGSVIGRIPGVRIFTFLRDPVGRALSAYQYAHHRGREVPPFEAWAEANRDFLCRALTGAAAGEATAEEAIGVLTERVGFVGLLREFDLSLVLLRRWLALPGFEIAYRSRNRATDNRVKRTLKEDPANLELLRSLNGEDLRLYEHAERVFEGQKEAYGPGLAEDFDAFRERLKTGRRPLPRPAAVWGRLHRDLFFRPAWKRRLQARKAAAS